MFRELVSLSYCCNWWEEKILHTLLDVLKEKVTFICNLSKKEIDVHTRYAAYEILSDEQNNNFVLIHSRRKLNRDLNLLPSLILAFV